MRKLIEHIRHSLSARLSIWVVLFAALIFLATQIFVTFEARKSIRSEAVKTASQVLDNTILRLYDIMDDVKYAADNLEWLVYRHLDEPDGLMDYTRSTLQGHPFLNGCSISFEPYFYKGQKYFSAYSSNIDGVVETEQEGADNYQYFYLDWYLLPKLLNQPCWTEPYNDWEDDDEDNLRTEKQISYCKPLTAADGSYIGGISLDLSIKWLSETILQVQPFPHSYSFLVGRGGTFLVHPDQTKLFYQTLFTNGLDHPDPDMDALGQAMINLEEGMKVLDVDGVRSYVFYKPLKGTGWSVGLVCPAKEIYIEFNHLRTITLGLLFTGLLLMFLTSYRVIKNRLMPLKTLARHTEKIASGNFKEKVPRIDREDEIGTLSRSFTDMQASLVKYINELTRTTAQRERMEGELKIARDIQMTMVPRSFPQRDDIGLYASMTPAREVGGDLYDFFIENDKLFFCIGDVSGKGVPASLFMAVARSLFRVVGQHIPSPSEIAKQINDTLVQDNEQMMFVTMFIGVLDLKTQTLTYCNCGHNPPVLIDADGCRFMKCIPNMPIGAVEGFKFEEQTLPDFKGKKLFLYTDGLNEAENEAHQEFGNDRLLDTLSRFGREGSRATVNGMIQALARHVGKAQPSDDLTMLCLRIKG